MRHNTLTPPVAGKGDDDDTSRVWTEIEVQDPLDSSLAPIVYGTFQDSDSDNNDHTSDPLPDLIPAEEFIEQDILSDIEDHLDYLHKFQDDDIPMHEPVQLADLPGKRPRDDN